MLYYLFRFLEQWGISGSHMWGYISFRRIVALHCIIDHLCLVWRNFIEFLKSKQITETQRDASIDPFLESRKSVFLPMGGVIIIMAILIPRDFCWAVCGTSISS